MTIPAAPASKQRILVVDDDEKIAALLAEFFRDHYDVEVAMNGIDGLGAVQHRRPDVVLLDINMPGLDGLTVLKRIKRLDERLPVIMVTGNSEIAAAEDALKSGAFAYLPKPFQLQYAAHLVAAALVDKRRR